MLDCYENVDSQNKAVSYSDNIIQLLFLNSNIQHSLLYYKMSYIFI